MAETIGQNDSDSTAQYGDPAELLCEAMGYIAMGYGVLPLVPGEKRPLLKGGYRAAITDADGVRRAWARWPWANVGLVCERIVVIDVDDLDSPWLTEARREALRQATAIVRTPRGLHYYFALPELLEIPRLIGGLAPGVDVLGSRGHLTAPPSVGPSGGVYLWLPDKELCPLHQMRMLPDVLLTDILLAQRPQPAAAPVGDGVIGEGSRNRTLASIAGNLRRNGFNEAAILGQLAHLNQTACRPPLPESEVQSIARSIGQYDVHHELQAASAGCAGRAVIRTASDVQPEAVEWIWADRFERGSLNLVVAPPGVGKTQLVCAMSANLTRGTRWCDGAPCEACDVLLVNAEDSESTVLRPRLEANGADLSGVHFLSGVSTEQTERARAFTVNDEAALRDALQRYPNVRMVVIDPIGSFLGGRVDAHRDNEVREALSVLQRVGRECGVAVVLIVHTRKDSSGAADDRVLGSRGFTGLARAVHHLVVDPDDADRRLLLPSKISNAARPDGVAFRLQGDPARVVWDTEPVTEDVEDLYARMRRQGGNSVGRPATRRDAAEAFLRGELAAGPQARLVVQARARTQGIAAQTLRRACRRLGVILVPGRQEMWALPEGSQNAPSTGNME